MIGNIRNDFFKLTLTPPPDYLPQSLCMWYKGIKRLLLVLLVFLSCFSLNFFLLLLFSCLCTGMLRMFFLYFPFFSFFFLFVLFLFLHAFFLLHSIRENWSKINIVWIDIMHIWVKEFVVRLMMLLLFLCKALILEKNLGFSSSLT